MAYTVCIGVFVLALASCGHAIMCYTCDTTSSSTSAGCADTFNSLGSGVTKVSGCTYCSKMTGSYQGLTVVSRGCETSTSTVGVNLCYTPSPNALGISGTVCSCSTDLCNSAPAAMLPSAAALIIVALMMLRNLML